MADNDKSAMQMTGKPMALVLGATGGIGNAVAAKLVENGYTVRAMHRKAADHAIAEPRYEWVRGDAMNREDVLRAAAGAELIVHAVNPPGYRNWGTLVLPMIDNTIAAAEAVGARILMPGTVYNYGPDALGENVVEDSPQNPVTVKGKIRVELEQKLGAAARRGTQVILVRAGDFFGPGAGNNWLAQVVVKSGSPVKIITNPADAGVGHQWAYLPDVAETMMQLVHRAGELPEFARFHMDGFWDHDGQQMGDAIRKVVGRPDLPMKRFPWLLVRLGSPFVPFFRELLEMRYLWQRALRMRNDRLVALLGAEPHTPIDLALRETLASLGCIEPERSLAAPAKLAATGDERVSA